MVHHNKLGKDKYEIQQKLGNLIRHGEIKLGGYKKAKIYGTLHCGSGKRMKMENRVFFKDEAEAILEGYRPCGNCMPEKYRLWKISGCL